MSAASAKPGPDKFPVTREGFEFLKVLATFMDTTGIDQSPDQNQHPLSQIFEFLEAYLPKVKALEAQLATESELRLNEENRKVLGEYLSQPKTSVTERTALKALRAYCVYQRENLEKGIREKPTHPRARDWSAYEVAYTDVINEIDAQEKSL